MNRIAFVAAAAASLLFAGAAQAETAPGDKPAVAPKTAKPATKPKTAKTDTKTAAKLKRITYACDGGVNLMVTYPPEAQAKTRPVKVAMKDTVYFVRPAGEADKYENKKIKLVFQTKGEEATIEREGKPLAEKCKATTKPGT